MARRIVAGGPRADRAAAGVVAVPLGLITAAHDRQRFRSDDDRRRDVAGQRRRGAARRPTAPARPLGRAISAAARAAATGSPSTTRPAGGSPGTRPAGGPASAVDPARWPSRTPRQLTQAGGPAARARAGAAGRRQRGRRRGRAVPLHRRRLTTGSRCSGRWLAAVSAAGLLAAAVIAIALARWVSRPLSTLRGGRAAAGRRRAGHPVAGRRGPARGAQAGGQLQHHGRPARGPGPRPPGDDGRRLASAAHPAGRAAAAARPARPGLRRSRPRSSWPAPRRRSPGCPGWSTGCWRSPGRRTTVSAPVPVRRGRGGQRPGRRLAARPRRSAASRSPPSAREPVRARLGDGPSGADPGQPARQRAGRGAARRPRPGQRRAEPATGAQITVADDGPGMSRAAAAGRVPPVRQRHAGRHRARPGHRAPAGDRPTAARPRCRTPPAAG